MGHVPATISENVGFDFPVGFMRPYQRIRPGKSLAKAGKMRKGSGGSRAARFLSFTLDYDRKGTA